MKYFVPLADNDIQANNVISSIESHLQNQGLKVKRSNVYSMRFNHDGKQYEAIIGEKTKFNNEIVISIFENDGIYYVCTPTRGVLRGQPILVGKHSTSFVENFD